MSPAPAGPKVLLGALREAEAALEAGASLEQVRQDLEPRLAILWPWLGSAEQPSARDREIIHRLLRQNDRLKRATSRLTLDVQVLLEVLHRGELPPPGPTK